MYCTCQQVHWIYHKVYCRDHHVHQEPHLSVLHLPSSVLNMQSFNIRSNTGVYYISHQVYLRPCCSGAPLLHLPSSVCILSCKSGASLSYCICHTGVLHMLSCTSGASLGCLHKVCCRNNHVQYIRGPT